MSLRCLFLIFIITFVGFTLAGQSVDSSLDKEKLYLAMSADEVKAVEFHLKKIESSTDIESEAFEGALLMKKAGLIKGAKEKISVFKDGHRKLENSIKVDSTNPEYRFLRLMIQENAPKILNYNKDISNDHAILVSKFKTLSAPVQDALLSYCKKSKVLKTTDFR